MEGFSQLTIEKIKYYVYCLNDPETNLPFYIGKGKGNRVFNHAKGEKEKDANHEKIEIIDSIRRRGLNIGHEIIRYGLTEEVALEVECALIDFAGLENLSNIVKGHNWDRGRISCEELEIQLGAKDINIEDSLMIIKINNLFHLDMNENQIYEATRKSWVANIDRARSTRYVLGVAFGIVRGVYEPIKWDYSNGGKRIEFIGKNASREIQDKYLHRKVDILFRKGIANPIAYFEGVKNDK